MSAIDGTANPWDKFREELRDVLPHLFNPDYQSSELLCAVLGCDPVIGSGAVQSIIIQAIEELKIPEAKRAGGRAGRAYAILHQRFVLGLTQEDTAENLDLSVRHLGRVQREAIHFLARRLWDRHNALEDSSSSALEIGLAPAEEVSPAQNWRSQVQSDVTSLQQGAPNAVADVRETIAAVIALGQKLAAGSSISFVQYSSPGLRAAIHPSILRQVLLSSVGWLIRNTVETRIELEARKQKGMIEIVVSGTVPAELPDPNTELSQDMLARYQSTAKISRDNDSLRFILSIPAAGDITVLIVDDNPDMMYFYRRCVSGTQYQIITDREGKHIFDTVAAHAPQIIVLDIMLPDVDGWELLSKLHQHPATRHLPVIVSSVVRERDLAMALGAVQFLAKPFTHHQFLEALNEAIHSDSIEAQPSQASNARPV